MGKAIASAGRFLVPSIRSCDRWRIMAGRCATHALAPGSPAIDAGNPAAVAGIGGVPQFDLRGEPFVRVFDGRIDIGAFEFQMTAPTELVVDILVDESDGNYAPGDLSLREAAQLANLAPDTSTIQFSPALTAGGPATLALTRGAVELVGSVSIIGPGADLLTIDASGSDPTPGLADGEGSGIFILGDDVEDLFDAQISGLTLTGGDTQYGGAILSTENLTLQNCTITGNYAAQLGGGVAALYGDVLIDNCLITNNGTDETTSTGGGIAASSTASLVITNSTISDNASAVGGGIHAYDTHLSVRRLHDLKQYRLRLRGLRWRNLPQKRRARCRWQHNLRQHLHQRRRHQQRHRCHTHWRDPAWQLRVLPRRRGLFVRQAANSRVNDYLQFGRDSTAAASVPAATFKSTVPRSKKTRPVAGAACLGRSRRWTAHDHHFHIQRQLSHERGRRLWVTGVDATATITHSTIAENRTSQLVGFGGGITIRNVTLLVENSTVSGNSAATGGGFYADESALSIIDSSVESNSADGYTSAGGGIYQTLGTLTIVRGSISENSAKTGGGIYASGQLALTRTTIRDNIADLDGGGILTGW